MLVIFVIFLLVIGLLIGGVNDGLDALGRVADKEHQTSGDDIVGVVVGVIAFIILLAWIFA